MGFLSNIASSIFSSSKLGDTAIDYIRKEVGLNDMTPEQKADFVLKYISASKYQSPVRRFIAIMIAILWVFVALLWIMLNIWGHFSGHAWASQSASDFLQFFVQICTPFGVVLAFYFGAGVVNTIKSK